MKYFLFSLVVLSASAFNQAPSVTAAGGVSPVFLTDVASIERRTFELINNTRRSSGLRELEWNTDLYRMARSHSDSMARYNFFSHTDSRGLGMVKRARLTGLEGWRALGENLAYNLGYSDPAAFAVDAWIESQEHRHNMLRPMFTHTAIGVAYMPDGRIFFTEVFGSK
ncbi:MAG: CAP domain-containing protein [Pyrinomonadaceae bacterium]